MLTIRAKIVTTASAASLAGLGAARPRPNPPRTTREVFHRECSRPSSSLGLLRHRAVVF
jgi:hypothetical protein